MDRKTARRYVEPRRGWAGPRRRSSAQLTDELVGPVIAAVRPARPGGTAWAWETMAARHEQIQAWVKAGLTLIKIQNLLGRGGVVSYRTLHRYCHKRMRLRPPQATSAGRRLRAGRGVPGRLRPAGMLTDPPTGGGAWCTG